MKYVKYAADYNAKNKDKKAMPKAKPLDIQNNNDKKNFNDGVSV